MTDEQKIILLKEKLHRIMTLGAQGQKDQAEAAFLSLFNAVKDNDQLFRSLTEEKKQLIEQEEQQLTQRLQQITQAKSAIDSELERK